MCLLFASPCLCIPCSTISGISMSVTNSSFTVVFFKYACYVRLVPSGSEPDKVHLYLNIYL